MVMILPMPHALIRLNARALIFAATLLLIISGSKPSFCAQPGGAGFIFLEEPLNARSIGMGSAGTAAAGGGFAYYNPSLIAFAPPALTCVEYGQMPQDFSQTHLESAWHLGNNFSGGVDWHLYSIGNIIPADEQGPLQNLTGSSQDTRVSLLAAYTFHRVALGLAINGMQEQIFTSTAYGVSLSAGAATAFLNDKLRVGVAAFHEGYATSYLTFPRDWERYRMPRSARAGAAYRDSLSAVAFTIAADGVYRDEDERFMLPVGLEIKPLPYIALRLGKRFNDDTQVFSCGIGIMVAPLTVDCSFVKAQLVNDSELHWLVGLTYALPRP
ncbi:MAG: hypothetical protein PHC61_08365 [Chitinivibrionales bacterium]|nr:hypothetical protein [Chitinivibrionales bacterium]